MSSLQSYLDVMVLCYRTLTIPMSTILLLNMSSQIVLMNTVFLLYRVTCMLESWLPHAGSFIHVMLRLLREAVMLLMVLIPTPAKLLRKPLFPLKMCKAMKELLLCFLS